MNEFYYDGFRRGADLAHGTLDAEFHGANLTVPFPELGDEARLDWMVGFADGLLSAARAKAISTYGVMGFTARYHDLLWEAEDAYLQERRNRA